MPLDEVQESKHAFDNSLEFIRFLLNIYGFWPYDILCYKEAHTVKEKCFWALRRVVMVTNMIFVISEILFIFLVAKGSIIPTLECIATLVCIVFYTASTYIVYYEKDKIIHIIDTLRSYTEIQTKANFTMFKTYSLRIKIFAYGLYIITANLMTIYVGIPIWLAYKEQKNNKDKVVAKPLPFNSWYPYDANAYPYYAISLILEVFRGVGMLPVITGYDAMFVLIVGYTCGQYSILKSNFQNIFEEARENLKDKVNVEQFKDDHVAIMLDEEVNKLLKKHIKHHIALNDLCDKEEQIFSFTIFLHLALHSIILCSVMYLSLISMGNDDIWNLAKYTSFITLLIIQLFFYGYIGTMLIEASTSVGNGCFHSEWYETSSKQFKSSLLIVLHRTQIPCILTGLKFSVLSLEIVLAILSSSYSYFTLLNTVN